MGLYQPNPWHGHYQRAKPRFVPSAITAPTISSGTPTSTSDTTPNIGFTTNYKYGIGYAVVSTSALTGITPEQIAAGTNQSDTPLPAAQVFTAAITSNTADMPQSSVSALATGTWYAAAIHDNGVGTSAVLSWTFTITSASSVPNIINHLRNQGMI